MNIKNNYDVIVAGGGTAGCAAAYMLGKLGVKTLLIEENIHLGGSITSALVVPAMNTSKDPINNEFFEAFISELKKIGGQVTYDNNPGWFNPELAKIALDRLLDNENIDILLNSKILGVTYDSKFVKGVELSEEILSEPIEAKYIVDATGNCEISFLANCNFLQNKNETQPISLRFIMSGVDLKIFSKWIMDFDKDRNVTSSFNIENEIHLSTAYTWDNDNWALKPLFDDAVSKNILKDWDRNYFQVFSIPGMPNSIAFNCPRILNEVDILDKFELSKAIKSAHESILRLSEFCKIYFPGFEHSYISNIADSIGVRVSRRIKGKYIYTSDDLKSGKMFKNSVLKGNYPIDVHSNKKGQSVLEHTLQDYYLPIESLISDDFDNLFVIGRSISADFMAQAALRIQPSCFSMGVGVAKHIANLLK